MMLKHFVFHVIDLLMKAIAIELSDKYREKKNTY